MPPRRRKPPLSAKHAALGEAIRRRRKELDWTQHDLAFEAKTDETQIGAVERGTRTPGLWTLIRLEDALGLRLSELFAAAERILEEGVPEAHREGSDSAQTSSTSRNHSASTSSAQP